MSLMPEADIVEEEKRIKKSLRGRLHDYEASAADILTDFHDPKSTGRASKKLLTALDNHPTAKLLDSDEDGSLKLSDNYENAPGDFIWTAMREAFDPETNSMRDLKIDDRDLLRADNFYDYSTRVVGKSIKAPFARQLWISYHLLGEYCPRCTPPKYIHDVLDIPVDMDPADLYKKVTFLKSGVCPSCGATKSKLILDGELRDNNQLAMAAGQRGGKSSFIALLNSNLLHRFLKAPRLSSLCRGIQDFTPLTFTFVGLTAGRAIRLLWNPFTEIIKASSWFKSYFDLMDHYGKMHGKEYYKDQVLFYRFFAKNIDVYPMGPIKRTLRGDTRVAASVDEIGWFPLSKSDEGESEEDEDSREHANADEVYTSLDNSLMTVRNEVYGLYQKGVNHIPTGYMMNISSPQSERDKIMRLVRESEEPEALSVGVQLATWEISPLYTRDHPTIMTAYRRNKVKAERDFGARPPSLTSSIFPESTVLPMFSLGSNSHRLEVVQSIVDEEEESDVIRRTVPKLLPIHIASDLPPSILSMDAGLTNNSFALTIGFPIDDNRIRATTVLEIIPRKGTQIDFPGVYRSVIKPLIDTMNVHIVAADRWNSIMVLQTIADEYPNKVKCIQRTLNAKDFRNFMASVGDGGFEFPTSELSLDDIRNVKNYKREMVGNPVAHLVLQFFTVKFKGAVLEKGDGWTDDVLRSVAVLHSVIFEPKARAFLNTFRHISGGVEDNDRGYVISGSRYVL